MGPQDYSAFADLLNKFHTAAPAIQALWILAVAATILGVAWLVTRALRDIAASFAPRAGPLSKSLLVYGVVQDEDGRWLVIRNGLRGEPADLPPAPAPDRLEGR